MADQTYFAVLTDAGAALEARAIQSGKGIVLTHIAIGDANKQAVTPVSHVTKLVHEVLRRPIDARTIDRNDPSVSLIHATIPAHIGGFWIYELGVYGHLEGESSETLFSYANHAPYYKMTPQTGQIVTHEILIPVIQSTDARLIIELPDSGYVTRRDFINPQRAVWNLAANVGANQNTRLPDNITYQIGQNRLELYWLGLKLAKGKDYEESGECGDFVNSVKLLFAAEAGDEFQAEIFN